MVPSEWESDFRRQAIETSLGLVSNEATDDPIAANVSLCLPTSNSRTAMRAGLVLLVCSIFLAIVLITIACKIYSWQQRLPEGSQDGMWNAAVFLSSILGFVCLFLPLKGGGLAIRPFLGNRLKNLKADPSFSSMGFVSSVEDSATFSEIKVISEDSGYIAHDPVNRRIVLEGVLCRYVIYGKDVLVLSSEFGASVTGTRIAYQIGDQIILDIVIEQMSLFDETVRQLTGRVRNRGFESICSTIGFEEGSPNVLESQEGDNTESSSSGPQFHG